MYWGQALLLHDRLYPTMVCIAALTHVSSSSGWVPNTSLQELSPEAASAAINDKMRKDLQSAYELASKGNDLDFYKGLLQQFQEELVAKEEAQKAKKKRASAVDEMDIDAVDKTPAKKSKKRKAEDEVAVSVSPGATSLPSPVSRSLLTGLLDASEVRLGQEAQN